MITQIGSNFEIEIQNCVVFISFGGIFGSSDSVLGEILLFASWFLIPGEVLQMQKNA